jgi:hypothetical protein
LLGFHLDIHSVALHPPLNIMASEVTGALAAVDLNHLPESVQRLISIIEPNTCSTYFTKAQFECIIHGMCNPSRDLIRGVNQQKDVLEEKEKKKC